MRITSVLAIALAAALPLSAHAHKAWLLPSATVLPADAPWITVDGAVSNDLFYFNHVPLRTDGLSITTPDGSKLEPQNAHTGKYRSVFDVQLVQQGTYRIALVNHGLAASWEENGAPRRWRGNPEAFAKEVPKDAKNLQVTQSASRVETFVTSGAPTTDVLKPTGKGLELVPVTHPNDLFAGEEATFKFLLDGKPAGNIDVVVVPGGIRYRDQLNEIRTKTDADGAVKVTMPEPGFYWLSASARNAKPTIDKAKSRNASYAATLEVLAQ